MLPWLLPLALLGFLIPVRSPSGQAQPLGKMIFGPFLTYGPQMPGTIENLALQIAKARLTQHEGRRHDVYLDSRNIPTVGIGHKVTPFDNLRTGQLITDARIDALFDKDIALAFSAAKAQAREINKYTSEFIAALTEVNFQLGAGWTQKFPNTWNDIRAQNIASAIKRLRQSDWYTQTPTRVASFISALEGAFT